MSIGRGIQRRSQRTSGPTAGRNAARRSERDSEINQRDVSLCEALDRILYKGVVVRGDITISVAGTDLVYLGLNVLLSSTDTAADYAQHYWNEKAKLMGHNPELPTTGTSPDASKDTPETTKGDAA